MRSRPTNASGRDGENIVQLLAEGKLCIRRPDGNVLLLSYRNKTGILGWRSEKTETVNGYEAKVDCSLTLSAESTAVRALI